MMLQLHFVRIAWDAIHGQFVKALLVVTCPLENRPSISEQVGAFESFVCSNPPKLQMHFLSEATNFFFSNEIIRIDNEYHWVGFIHTNTGV